MKIKEIVDMTPPELLLKERELRQELFNLRMHACVGRAEKPSRFRDLKKDIARVLTVLAGKTGKGKSQPTSPGKTVQANSTGKAKD